MGNNHKTIIRNDQDIDDIVINILVHSSILIQNIDNLSEYPIFRHELKKTANIFLRELEKTTPVIHNNLRDRQEEMEVAAIYDDYYKMIWSVDNLTIDQRTRIASVMVELVKKIKTHKKVGVVDYPTREPDPKQLCFDFCEIEETISVKEQELSYA